MTHTEFWKSTWREPVIEHGVPSRWNWIVLYPHGLRLGRFTDIGAFTLIMARQQIIIEDDVEIGSHCAIYSESSIDEKEGTVILRKGCKIGTHTTIMPNVTVGENAIIGAYSFVKYGSRIRPGSIGWGIPYRAKKPNEWAS